ncbi:MAG: ABC transporter ATP-binding protein [Streptosporangiales bacterium]
MLDLHGVGFAYAPGQWVFRDVSLSLPAGSVTAVLGPNGKGKTTLLRCAAGLLKPQEGSVRHESQVVFVPQAHAAAFAFRVIDMVLMGRVRHVRTFASPGRQDHVAAMAALERVGIVHLADRQFSRLSGGEQRLVTIARAVASDSEVLALDEPATGLDLRNQGRILTLLRELAENGMAVLTSTHHPDHAMYVADTACLMLDPEDVRVDAADRLLTDAMLSALYGIEVRTVSYDDNGTRRRGLVTRYGS